MRWFWVWAIGLILAGFAARVDAQTYQVDAKPVNTDPKYLVLPPDTESVYAPPAPPSEEDGINQGGVNFDFAARYLTDYVYRGVSRDHTAGGDRHAANFQIDTQAEFNLGKFVHPYIGVFANINDSDPLSRFQEFRPRFGFEYTLRPLNFDIGHNTYLYPERERLNPSPNTSEVYLKITLDDSYFLLTPKPILSPYIYAAYDYQRNNGWYIEAGLKHDFVFEDLGFTLTAFGDVAWISDYSRNFVTVTTHDSGFQHYDAGVIGTFSLNSLFKVPPRYGDFGIQGFLTYTGRFSNPLLAESEIWGGTGLVFRY